MLKNPSVVITNATATLQDKKNAERQRKNFMRMFNELMNITGNGKSAILLLCIQYFVICCRHVEISHFLLFIMTTNSQQ